MRENDVYRWSWSDEDSGPGYHCMSQIAIVKDGDLLDTFWYYGPKAIPRSMVDIELIGNLDDFREAPHDDLSHYDQPDVLDMRHRNNSSPQCKFVRVGAMKSQKALREKAIESLKSAQRLHSSSFREVVRARECLDKIDRGQVDGVYP